MMQTRGIAIGLLLFVLLEAALILFVDRPVAEMLRNVDAQHPAVIDFFRAWTNLGKSKWYLWPAAAGIILCAALIRQKNIAEAARDKLRRIGDNLLFLFICVAGSGIITDIIKPLLGRARPVELVQEGLYGFRPISFAARWNSFPSGHSTTAFALALSLSAFFPRLRVPFFLYAVALAISRVMVNAHFISDVLAGGLVALLTFEGLQLATAKSGIFHIRKCIFPIDGMASPG